MDCWIVIAGGSYRISSARSYRFAALPGVFHPVHDNGFTPERLGSADASIDLLPARSYNRL
jgi:hypothetical protein